MSGAKNNKPCLPWKKMQLQIRSLLPCWLLPSCPWSGVSCNSGCLEKLLKAEVELKNKKDYWGVTQPWYDLFISVVENVNFSLWPSWGLAFPSLGGIVQQLPVCWPATRNPCQRPRPGGQRPPLSFRGGRKQQHLAWILGFCNQLFAESQLQRPRFRASRGGASPHAPSLGNFWLRGSLKPTAWEL